MCGTSTRVSQGGSIAVLRPTRHLHRTPSTDLILSFSNRLAARGTSVEVQGWDRSFSPPSSPSGPASPSPSDSESDPDPDSDSKHWVVIHHDGDLSSPSHTPPPAKPFFSFPLADFADVVCLPQRLELGVGGMGIVGRRVSVVRGLERVTVAEGVIGWN